MSLRDLDKVILDGSKLLVSAIKMTLGRGSPMTVPQIVEDTDLSFLPPKPDKYSSVNPFSPHMLVMETLEAMIKRGIVERQLTGRGETYEISHGACRAWLAERDAA
jgi:hypothetical protein